MFPGTQKNTDSPSPEQRNQVNEAFGLDDMLSELNQPKQIIESSVSQPPPTEAEPDQAINDGYTDYLSNNEPTAQLSDEAALNSGKIAAATVDNLAGSGMAAYARNNDPEKYQATPKQIDLLAENWAAVIKKRGSVIEQHPELVLAINNLAIYGSNFRVARIDKEMTEMKTEISDLQKEVERIKEEKMKAKNS